MAFSPVRASKEIALEYSRYLTSIFSLNDPDYQQQFSARLREMPFEILDHAPGGRQHLVFSDFYPHSGEFPEIIRRRLGRIVRQKTIADSLLLQPLEKRQGEWKNLIPEINRPVHVHDDMTDFPKTVIHGHIHHL